MEFEAPHTDSSAYPTTLVATPYNHAKRSVMTTSPDDPARFMTPKPSAEFVDELYYALHHDRALTRTVSPILWKGAQQVRRMDMSVDDRRRDAAAAEAAAATRIATHARALLTLLERLDPAIRTAFVRGDLPRTLEGWERFRPRAASSQDWSDWGWDACVHAREWLPVMIRESDQWASATRVRAKRSRGPRFNPSRIFLSEWVAIQLARAGVRPTKAKNGVFARVLAVAQAAAGFRRRTAPNLERDVRRALSTTSVVERIARELQQTTAT
jgi:hypothetical protein